MTGPLSGHSLRAGAATSAAVDAVVLVGTHLGRLPGPLRPGLTGGAGPLAGRQGSRR